MVGHNIGGNQLRHADAVRFDPGGARARPPLPRWLEAIIILLCGPLMWRYGYRLGGGALGRRARRQCCRDDRGRCDGP